MKRLFLILLAICTVLIIVYNSTLNVTEYLHQFDKIPDFTDLIDDLNNCWQGVGFEFDAVAKGFEGVNDVVSFFSALGQVFVALWSVLKGVFVTLVYLPTKLLIYVISTIYQLIPHSEAFKEIPTLIG